MSSQNETPVDEFEILETETEGGEIEAQLEELDFIESNAASEVEEAPTETVELSGSELESFEAAAIEDVEFIEVERLESIIESVLFASDRPVSLASLKLVFKG